MKRFFSHVITFFILFHVVCYIIRSRGRLEHIYQSIGIVPGRCQVLPIIALLDIQCNLHRVTGREIKFCTFTHIRALWTSFLRIISVTVSRMYVKTYGTSFWYPPSIFWGIPHQEAIPHFPTVKVKAMQVSARDKIYFCPKCKITRPTNILRGIWIINNLNIHQIICIIIQVQAAW